MRSTKTGFLFLAFFLLHSVLNGQMQKMHLGTDPAEEIISISFFSENKGYLATNKWIGFTADTGRTFDKKFVTLNNVDYSGYPVNLTFGFTIKGVQAFSETELVVFGHYGFVPAILRSTNGGQTFKLVYHSLYNPNVIKTGITDMKFFPGSNIGLACDADRVLKTMDKGLSWSVVRVDPNSYFDRLELGADNSVTVMSLEYTSSKVIHSSNGGQTFSVLQVPDGLTNKVKYAYFLNNSLGWLHTINDHNEGLFYKTTNGGMDWILINNPGVNPFFTNKFYFASEQIGYAIAGHNTIIKTVNGGYVWEPLTRDNDFFIISRTHASLVVSNETTIWAGGAQAFVEYTNNGGGETIPKAFFTIDTAGVFDQNRVHLKNLSRENYSFKWFVNGTEIGQDYNTSYLRDASRLIDTVMLIVNNGVQVDSMVRVHSFPKRMVITGFTPVHGKYEYPIKIYGQNFTNITHVSFGGVPALAFNVISPDTIMAHVGNGASGEVRVASENGYAQKDGFVFLDYPVKDLPVELSSSVLCKEGKITIQISNTQAEVLYELVNTAGVVYASKLSTGGNIIFESSTINKTGNYVIRATQKIYPLVSVFSNPFYILVEQTEAKFAVSKLNIEIGEKHTFQNFSKDAQTFLWSFDYSANSVTSEEININDISYSTTGYKKINLEAISQFGCRDTITADSVIYVYERTVRSDSCDLINVYDRGIQQPPFYHHLATKPTLLKDNGFVIAGYGNQLVVQSRIGLQFNGTKDGESFLGRYTQDGVLKWYMTLSERGRIVSAVEDAHSNLYIIGSAPTYSVLQLADGNSLKITETPFSATSYNKPFNTFILKVDSSGKYLWHGILEGPDDAFHVVNIKGVDAKGINFIEDDLLLSGYFTNKIHYWRNGVKQELFNISNENTNNYYVIRMRQNGDINWHMYINNFVNNTSFPVKDIHVDSKNNFYIAGNFEYRANLYDVTNTAVNFNSPGVGMKSYLVKYDKSGKILWYNLFRQKNFPDGVGLLGISENINNGVTISGSASAHAIAPVLQVVKQDTLEVKIPNLFIMDFDSSGNYNWTAGVEYSTFSGGNAPIKSNSGNFYLAASGRNVFNNEFGAYKFYSSDSTYITDSINFSEFFIMKYDEKGILSKIAKSGYGTDVSILTPFSLDFDKNNNLITGVFADVFKGKTTVFDHQVDLEYVDIFLARLKPGFCKSGDGGLYIANKNINICQGDQALLEISNPGNATKFSWFTDDKFFISNNASVYVSPASTTTYYLLAMGLNGNIIRDTVTVNVGVPSGLAGNDKVICNGSSVLIGSAEVPGYTYSWSVNGEYMGSLASLQVSPDTTTFYTLKVLNSTGCEVVDTVKVQVKEKVLLTFMELTNSADTVCKGTAVNFKVNTNSDHLIITYKWKKNGRDVGVNNSAYSDNDLSDNDKVWVELMAVDSCNNVSSLTSDVVSVKIVDGNSGITIDGKTDVSNGISEVYVANLSNVYLPYRLLWQDSLKNATWKPIPGAEEQTLNYMPTVNSAGLRCLLISSNPCNSDSVVISNKILLKVESLESVNEPLSLSPNPANNFITIDNLKVSDNWRSVNIFNLNGRAVLLNYNIERMEKVVLNVAAYSSGLYIIQLHDKKGGSVIYKFIKL